MAECPMIRKRPCNERNTMTSIVLKSAKDQAIALRQRTMTATELLEAHFKQIDKFNPDINAVIWQDREAAKASAWEMDNETAKGKFRGPLHGVPVTVKESFDLSGAPTTWGDPEHNENLATSDSDPVARLRAAGAIVFGKTNVPLNLVEWQSFNQVYGTTKNPWDQTRTPGGSSGGSAAAIATGMSALEVGSDIGSSIRNPAHFCGVFGLKPTHKVVSSHGQSIVESHAETDIAVAGPLARTADDLKIGFETILGLRAIDGSAFKVHLPEDNRDRLSEFRIGIKLDDAESPVDEGYLAALDEFVHKLEKAGAKVIRDKKPRVDSTDHYTLYLSLLGAAMSARITKKETKALLAGVKAMNNGDVMRVCGTRYKGLSISHSEWLNLDAKRNLHRLIFDNYFKDVDILIAPAAGTPAFKHNQKGPRYSRFLNINGKDYPDMAQTFWAGYSGVVGLPSVVGPVGQVNGLPIGYQGIAGHGRDFTALAFAAAVERELGGYIPPPLCL